MSSDLKFKKSKSAAEDVASDICIEEASVANTANVTFSSVSSQVCSSPTVSTAYIPLFYSEKIKNPGQAHFVKRVLFGHWAFGVIAWSCLSPHPVINAFSLFFLTISYWCVYEIGYQENDDIGARYEAKPNLSTNYRQYTSQINLHTPWPWVWAIALAIPGCLLFSLSQWDIPVGAIAEQLQTFDWPTFWSTVGVASLPSFAGWLVYLVVIRLTFWLYNQVNEVTRIWLYPILQMQRLFGFALLASTSAIGAMLMMAFVVSRWIQYCIYRCGGERKRFPVNISTFWIFAMLTVALALSGPTVGTLMTWQTAIAFLYCGLRAGKKAESLKLNIGWIKGRSTQTPYTKV